MITATALGPYPNGTRTREGWAAYLDGLCFTTGFTFTAYRSLRHPARMWEAMDNYGHGIAQRARGPVPWFAVMENDPPGHYHLHGLLRGVEALPEQELEARWKLGDQVRVEHFVDVQAPEDWLRYVVKRLPDDSRLVDYRFSRGFERYT